MGGHRFGVVTVVVGLCVALTGCGAGAEEPAVPDGFKRFGGPDNGVSVAVPESWTTLDLVSDDLTEGLASMGLTGDALEQTKRNLQPLVSARAIYAADPESLKRSASRFLTNLNGFCQPSSGLSADGLITAARDQLGRIKATVTEAAETQIDSGTAVRLVYTFPVKNLQVKGTQYHIPAGTRTCVITLSTDRDDMQELFDRIGTTIHPA